jgi:hypothetical protein
MLFILLPALHRAGSSHAHGCGRYCRIGTLSTDRPIILPPLIDVRLERRAQRFVYDDDPGKDLVRPSSILHSGCRPQ